MSKRLTYVSPPHPSVLMAAGFSWLLRYVNGESILHISKSVHHDVKTVQKYMRKAASSLVDAAQMKVMDELFPLVVDVYKAHLRQQLAKEDRGETVDLSAADRLLKSMYVFDSPQLAQDMTKSDGEAVETMAAFFAQRRAKPLADSPLPLIEVSTPNDQDPPADDSTSGTRALPDQSEGD